MPPPPKTDVPKRSNPPNIKFGISDTLDPISEFEKPGSPKPRFPKPELVKSPVPKRRELPKLAPERPPENGVNDEDCDIACLLDEKRFELNPRRAACTSIAFSRLAPAKEAPETFL
jgi:hypothetical protein